ncbi:Protein NRT1/ PTR FAMILY 7.3 [Hibiscus syriacus]|uniref:Protein NRT1/ PTR FAMILY 7.3 n=1 Tax=Hibiscus syriacus TaxID=106335 RepID=A0A6A2XN10_HIBSY|nr:Protein NRT1/ PTR FAMILY 7.3 [Hibiscus syriacus]
MIAVNQGLATLAFFGVGVNLVLFLTQVLDQDNASAANNVSKWTGTVYLCSLIGAFLSDSYWGRYLTCAIFQLILVLVPDNQIRSSSFMYALDFSSTDCEMLLQSLGLLSLASRLFLINPADCGDGIRLCNTPSQLGFSMFYLSIYLVAFGFGRHQPALATFGSDQFNDSHHKGANLKAAFFSYFYFALNVGSLFSDTILVYYENSGMWTLGFLVSFGSAIIALLFYRSGTPRYRYMKASGNPLPRVAQVFVAAYRKWGVTPANAGALFLDKAAMITPNDLSAPNNPWRLCTVTQVEEAKCVLKMLPIWLCTIMYSVIFTQMASLFVEQGDVMASKLGDFRIPAASMSAFDICSVLIWTGVYRHVVIPLARRLSNNPKGLTELQRMGSDSSPRYKGSNP